MFIEEKISGAVSLRMGMNLRKIVFTTLWFVMAALLLALFWTVFWVPNFLIVNQTPNFSTTPLVFWPKNQKSRNLEEAKL